MGRAAEIVRIHYTNHRGVAGWRRILPDQIRFAASAFHPQPQWLLDAFDLDKQAARTFAVKDIHDWIPDLEADIPWQAPPPASA